MYFSSLNLRNEMLPLLVHLSCLSSLQSGILYRITLTSFLRVSLTSLRKTFTKHHNTHQTETFSLPFLSFCATSHHPWNFHLAFSWIPLKEGHHKTKLIFELQKIKSYTNLVIIISLKVISNIFGVQNCVPRVTDNCLLLPSSSKSLRPIAITYNDVTPLSPIAPSRPSPLKGPITRSMMKNIQMGLLIEVVPHQIKTY